MSESIRAVDLQIEAIGRLKDALDTSAVDVIPAEVAAQRDDADPRVSVAATLDGSTHDNTLESQTVRVRVAVDGTREYVESNGTLGLKQIKKTVIDELTADSPAWGGEGVDTDEPVRWADNLNRYLGAVETVHERTDRHPQHTP